MNQKPTVPDLIGRCCVDALKAEVSATPKPGLVDRVSNGAHNDMDFDLFQVSITAIAPFFGQMADIGCRLTQVNDTTLAKVRPTGITCERAMFQATHGVNTHKGAIFSLGLIATAAGFCVSTLKDSRAETICRVAGSIARPAERDFQRRNGVDTNTHGQTLFTKYGIQGIRGEAAGGFPTVLAQALPVLRDLAKSGIQDQNAIHLQVLLHLMTQAEDTNVIARAGLEALHDVRSSAEHALAMGGALTPEGLAELWRMDQEFTKRNISPGGCADLLSVAIALVAIESSKLEAVPFSEVSHG